jgi:hypothetical protein
VDLVRESVAAIEADARDHAGERVRDVIEGVVIVIEDDHEPIPSHPRAGIGRFGALNRGRGHGANVEDLNPGDAIVLAMRNRRPRRPEKLARALLRQPSRLQCLASVRVLVEVDQPAVAQLPVHVEAQIDLDTAPPASASQV